MRILLAQVIMGNDLSGKEYQRFIQGTDMENTGLSVLRYGREGAYAPWELWTWNDHAHLG
jgi:hypothetical protein